MPPNNIAEKNPWGLVNTYLVGPYANSIRQHNPASAILHKESYLTCMKIINPMMAWFEIVEVPWFDLKNVADGNNE